MRSEIPSGRFFCLDEFHNFHMSDDVLRERLRSIDGIPAVSYQVNGENVFVFEKLVQLVKQNGHNLESALALVPKATMTAAEAIEAWSVFPEPYSRETNTIDHSQAIYHPYLNAYLPRKYPDRESCNADAARLLLGNPVEGEGDFVYRGQSMVLRQPFTLDRLPPRPEWDVPVSEDASAYTHLWNTDFVSGFAPVTESLFNGIKSAEWEWNHAIAATYAYMGNPECISSLWSRAGEFGLEQLELKSWDVDEQDPEHYQQFQALYPELSMLSPAIIQKAYDEYCESMWENPERCDGFLYHLIGSTVSSDTGVLGRQRTEAAHIKPRHAGGEPDVTNGILLRSDIHIGIYCLAGIIRGNRVKIPKEQDMPCTLQLTMIYVGITFFLIVGYICHQIT
ncbi:HNH endonuclease [Escherichia coli]|uniref:HNH endonuclease n=2 Tax=Enterobacteriaceae TaxID=543 RepID=UPI002072E867|nr:HNH endonuclease signature motif containing protein [Escherichia coli]